MPRSILCAVFIIGISGGGHLMPQKPEGSRETREWEEQKQGEAQRQAKEDKQETTKWEAEKEQEKRNQGDEQ